MVYRPQERIFMSASATAATVTLWELREHLRVSGTEEDGYISAIGMAAESAVEKFTQRLLSPRACTLYLPALPINSEPVELPGGAVSAVTSVLVDGVAVTGCTAIGDSPALLIPAASWGAATGDNYPVVITYTAGFTTIPADLSHAVKLIAADLYANREDGSGDALSISASRVMARWRILPI